MVLAMLSAVHVVALGFATALCADHFRSTPKNRHSSVSLGRSQKCHQRKSGLLCMGRATDHRTRGSLIRNVAPPRSRFFADICPFRASIMVRAMESPIPIPSALLV